jgi:UDP:flavonoid glycosyltransferase YjiC (YdhE family)
VALGSGLKERGHEVNLATHSTFEDLVKARGLSFSPLAVDPRAVVESLGKSGESGVSIMKSFRRTMEPALYQATQDALAACTGSEGVVVSSAAFFGYDVADALDIPFAGAAMQPLIGSTSSFPSALMPSKAGLLRGGAPARALSGLYNRFSHRAAEQLLWQPFRGTINKIRRDLLSLPPQPFFGPFREPPAEDWVRLHGWSKFLLDRPPDWGSNKPVTGYWFLDREESWSPPRDLVEFLDAGRAPVCMGFGSSSIADPERMAKVFSDTLRRLGQRGVLLGGWGGLKGANLPDNVFQTEEAPYDWLLPKTRGFIHHGSTGATHAALRAGIPSITVPSYGDQLLWGHLLSRSGVSPEPIPRRRLSSERLASAISTLLIDKRLRARAEELGEKMRGEDGVAEAVEVLQGLFTGRETLEST